MNSSIRTEAQIFGFYLIKVHPSKAAIDLYARAIEATNIKASVRDERLVAYARSHPHTLGLIDAGASLVCPQSDIRRRLYLMFSILETMPEYHHFFLPQKHNRWYLFNIFYFGLRGACKAIVGICLVKVVAR